ncbi:NAD(P)/FAD-dependent oxidoreductase [Candidatus Mycobacterium wuenschmannii]|uniref:NAD(P)/FAD-dependent oxidoreductase n=1 Tax=Candidatus Mycobacterium wuenschmannii TaxID=3027808 RepID=A0ABY8W3K8_9MYCO|nr:NAD(P)/FAD-dependent oxidoreductase [Candidatus Mycobacterium wuenschmannii]WIM88344.1 NAD(P)/FAD-dependent oxidoreductase [Candidatus Mycobacterium wuenschmannii]
MSQRHPSVGIIGAGMSGICQAILLRQAGVTDVTIYEKAGDVGGTWRDNTYPGLSCDVPSRFYQFTFAMNPGWTHLFSPGPEIHDYFEAITDRYRLREIIRFGVEIVDAQFADSRWYLTTNAGERVSHDFLVAATGVLREPRVPAINGLTYFEGPVMHSARWDHSVDMTGKRVAVIGTGSTGAQIVCGLADSAGRLDLFQRSAQWILPLPNPHYRRWSPPIHRRVPRLSALAYYVYHLVFEWLAGALVRPGWRRRFMNFCCRANLRSVRDPDLRRRLTPDYQPMCRRLIMSAGFYPAMQRDNVHLVDAGIDHVERRGIVTASGELRELDAIVLATGFDAHAFMRPMALTGRDGLTLQQLWDEGPRAHLGVALPGFPNFFMLMGPHSPVGNYSLTAIAEAQANHIVRWIKRWRTGEFDSVAPTHRATDDFNASMKRAMPGTVWATGCTSWYLGADGLPELWPWTPHEYRQRLAATPDINDYDIKTMVRTA